MMNYGIYQAIFKKNGGPFQSVAESRPCYDFPFSM